MQTIFKLILGILIVAPLTGSSQPDDGSKAIRVGGQYKVESIKEVSGGFEIHFTAEKPSGRFDDLKLVSDHVHFSVKEGQSIRLSAEILTENGANAEVSQVLLFLDHPQGYVPVWLLSQKSPNDLTGSKYLEMHAPQADYQVF